MRKDKKWTKWAVWLFVALMFFSPFAAFLQGGVGTITVDLEIRAPLENPQINRIRVANGETVKGIIDNNVAVKYSNQSRDIVECVNNKCGAWWVYRNDKLVVYLSERLNSGDKLRIEYK